MFTVVIAEESFIRSIDEYRMFLKPFLHESQITFCRWCPEGKTLSEMVPELIQTVNRHEQWRAVVVCDERGLKQRNPFDLSGYAFPEEIRRRRMERNERRRAMENERRQLEEDRRLLEKEDPRQEERLAQLEKQLQELTENRRKLDDYADGQEQSFLDEEWKARKAAYERAAREPLTRLATYFCESPMISDRPDTENTDPAYARYLEQSTYKEALRKQILDGYVSEFSLPAEFLCVARRTADPEEERIRSSWTPHVDFQYTRFDDWNLYYDKMRFLLFDILPQKHQNYTFDSIRFLYGVLMLAGNETPRDVLRPRRVYRIDFENDEGALRELMGRYESKLAATAQELSSKIHSLENTQHPHLSDRDVERIFCTSAAVPVVMDTGAYEEELYVSASGLGLATDVPREESRYWAEGYQKSTKAMHRYLKQPRRALKRASADARDMDSVDMEQVCCLNEFQLEDIREYVASEELKMVGTQTGGFLDPDACQKRREKASKQVEKKIGTRMKRKTTIALGIFAIGVYLLGFLPLIFNNLGNGGTIAAAIILMAFNLLLLGLVGFVNLFFLRRSLKIRFWDYNDVMRDLVRRTSETLHRFSQYLTHACNVMRGNSVLNYYESHELPENYQLRILRKHSMDVQCCREELREAFGRYLPEEITEGEMPYLYDFLRPVDFVYPIPYAAEQARKIQFMQPGHTITVPVSFVKRVSVRLEELYD